MAFTLTTSSAAMGVNDQTVLLASLSGLVIGSLMALDKEVVKVTTVPAAATTPVPVLRGQEGTFNQAHPSGTQVRIGAPGTQLALSDWPVAVAGAPSLALLPGAYGREVIGYSAAGAITLPRIGGDMVAVLNGTTLLAMTLANPSVGQDGSRLVIVGNGKAAHTVTYAAGLGNVGGTADVITFAAAQSQGIELFACGGFWVGLGMNTAVAGAGATINGVGLG